MAISKISARNDITNLIVSTGPDVCWTPMGSSKVAVPYISSARLDPALRLASSVRDNGRKDFMLNSRAAITKGHEPGTLKGVKVAGYHSISHCRVASATVYSEGWACVRDRDPAWVNRPDPGSVEPSRSKRNDTVDVLS